MPGTMWCIVKQGGNPCLVVSNMDYCACIIISHVALKELTDISKTTVLIYTFQKKINQKLHLENIAPSSPLSTVTVFNFTHHMWVYFPIPCISITYRRCDVMLWKVFMGVYLLYLLVHLRGMIMKLLRYWTDRNHWTKFSTKQYDTKSWFLRKLPSHTLGP